MKKFILLFLLFGSYFSFGQPLNMRVVNDSDFDVDFEMVSVSNCDGSGALTTTSILIESGYSSTIVPIGLVTDFWLAGIATNPDDATDWYRVMSLCDCVDMDDVDAWDETISVDWTFDSAFNCVLIIISNF